MLPVIAISPKPFLVIARDALKSANELPQHINVNAKIEGLILRINPSRFISSIIRLEMNAIQEID